MEEKKMFVVIGKRLKYEAGLHGKVSSDDIKLRKITIENCLEIHICNIWGTL